MADSYAHILPTLHEELLDGISCSCCELYCQVAFSCEENDPTELQYKHREHTILLSRERVNKGIKRMNSLPLSPLVVSFILRDFTGKTAA